MTVTDSCNLVYIINEVTDSRNVTDSRQQVSGTNMKTDSRNTCQKCGTHVPADQPIYLVRRWKQPTIAVCESCYEGPPGGYHEHPFHITPVVLPLAPAIREHAERSEDPDVRRYLDERERKPCDCGRELQTIWDGWYATRLPDMVDGQTYSLCPVCSRHLGRTNYWPAPYCSPECRRELRNSSRRLERQEHKCETCRQPFTPPRADSRYCSPACRQKAYRQRATEA